MIRRNYCSGVTWKHIAAKRRRVEQAKEHGCIMDEWRYAPRALIPIILSASVMLAGCAPSNRPPSDSEAIVQSVLALQASEGDAVCTDDRTNGDALAVFRQMTVAPRPSRTMLGWHSPKALRPSVAVSGKQLRGAEFDDDRLTIPEPEARRDMLSGIDQMRFTGAARYQARGTGVENGPVVIRPSLVPEGVTARWWPINRVRGDCWPLYLISDPVRTRDMAFVTVRAEHWGTLYALQKIGRGWRVVAEWSRWLY